MNSGPHKDDQEESGEGSGWSDTSSRPVLQDDDDKTVLTDQPIPLAPEIPLGEPIEQHVSSGSIPETISQPPETPRQAPASVTVVSGKLPPGTLINNNYEITEELNAGGMGEVYRGINIHGGPPVAIKAILQEKAEDNEAGLLFKREAMTLSHLVDETIVRYYNYVHDKDLNRYFLVMEFIDGMPLKDQVAQNGPLSAKEALILIVRLAGGLSKAHAQGVFHRDLSPDNIMLVGGSVAEARIIDFGIAKSTVFTEGTMHGRFAGKLKYVAPEQLGHFGGIIGPATDIYGLALLVCAAAIGKALPMGSTMVDAVESRRRIPDLSALDPELRPLLSYMLEPDPADRPASMAAVRKMAEVPTEIPAKYLRGWTPRVSPAEVETLSDDPTAGSGPVVTGTTGSFVGLQTPGQFLPADQTTQRERPMATYVDVDEDGDRRGRGLLVAMIVLFLGILGGAGWFAWTNMQPVNGTSTETFATAPTGSASGEVEGVSPAPTDSRAGFLASFDTGPCTFVTRVSWGPNTGTIEGYSTAGKDFASLVRAYEEAFGVRPSVLSRQITPAQCAVLDFIRELQNWGRSGIDQYLSADKIASGDTVTADLRVPRDQAVWTILIDHRGRIANLTDRLTQPVGNSRSLGFGLVLQGAQPQPHLVLSVESDSPLVQTVLAAGVNDAAFLLPRILAEIAQREGAASASLSYMSLVPKASAADL